ncbi:terminase large subunit [Agrobacterium vitis]|uniref:terminase large subunit n=1 Tax=Agrobacterium vitis TaxID=373 RepID=UPI0008FBAC6B|nr:terminase large subunit [Agrobacterium vitis]MUZ53039.1 terminase large subunit [Agrobacterium vitis]MUZ91258.1 terminase large subunit [Agrobacterium vitis]MVA40298.1 terminase large subunit [Agrobacterium vitis]NSX96144.1 terminase large subunit [Agrobacterium vitis]NSZ27283.1 terminase large subunit [Agrobacterium vitis]
MSIHVKPWDLSCPDWEERLMSSRSLVPDLPLYRDESEMAVAIFDELRLPDVIGMPKLRDACGDWFRDIVRAVFGSRDPATNERLIREVLALVPKGQSKTTYSGGMMITAMVMNQRPRAEMLFVGPTQAISDRAFAQAQGMIEADPDLAKRFEVKEHLKEIHDLKNKSKMKVKTFALDILTGSMPVFVLLDELWLLGRNAHAAKVIRQIRGGLEKNSEGFFMIISTQSDEPPVGVFKDELITARKIRDGKFRDKEFRAMLPVLYEFPDHIAKDPALWQDPQNWRLVMPNLGRSMRLDSLIKDWEGERSKGQKDIQIWASQHLNIEVGIGLKTDAWPGVDFWQAREDDTLTFETLLERSEVIVVGIDGGGLDDLFGFSALGREKVTKNWLGWSYAWCHEGVLERRQTIAAALKGFEEAKDLTIVDDELQDLGEIIEKIRIIHEAGLLACVAVDVEGPYGELVDELAKIDITQDEGLIEGVGQGIKLMNAIKSTERRLARGTFRVAKSLLMRWCVSNLKIEATATAIRATKQNAGDAKIDPAMALFDAASIMITNPEPKHKASVYEENDLLVV